MNACNCVERVYCEDCEHYDPPTIYCHYAYELRRCKKYARTLHTAVSKVVALGDVNKHNANNECEGFTPKLMPEPGEVVFLVDPDQKECPLGMALAISAAISLSIIGTVWWLT